MKLYRLERSVTIAAPLDAVWSFFADPHNLARITPESLNLRVPEDIPHVVHPGMIIMYTVRPFAGYRATWVTEITHVVERMLFVDEQRFGPYRFWHHQHHFRASGTDTIVSDCVHYALPFGPLGRLAHPLMVKSTLKDIFDSRLRALNDVFGSAWSADK